MEGLRGEASFVKTALEWGADPLFRITEPGPYLGQTPCEALELNRNNGHGLKYTSAQTREAIIVLLRHAEDQAHARRAQRALAVGMALHDRLGAQSPLQTLGPDPVGMIVRHAMPRV